MVDMDNREPHQHLWSDFKDLFKQEYAIQTNESLILEGLSSLAMKLNKTTNKVISSITDMVQVIKESFADFGGKIPEPLKDINGGISDESFGTFLKRHNAMMFNFFKMNLFKAALIPDLRSVMAQQDQETMTIQKMYKVATTAQREGKNQTAIPINEVREDEYQPDPEDNENDIASFNHWLKNQGGAWPKTGSQNPWGNCNFQTMGWGGQQNKGTIQQGGSGAGSNMDRNSKYCYYCKQNGHQQEECHNRMWDNKPCQDAQGDLYWPRIYLMEDNSEIKTVSTIDSDQSYLEERYCISDSGTAAQLSPSSDPGFHYWAGLLPSSKLQASLHNSF